MPSRSAQRHITEPPVEVRTSNPFATLTVDAGYVENMAEAIEKRLSESILIQSLLQAAREVTKTNRPVVRSTEQVPKAIPAPQPNIVDIERRHHELSARICYSIESRPSSFMTTIVRQKSRTFCKLLLEDSLSPTLS